MSVSWAPGERRVSVPGPPEVQLAVEGPLAAVTVGTGRRRNALTLAGWTRLADQLTQLNEAIADSEVRVVVVRGAGTSFCAGCDLNDWDQAPQQKVDASFAAMEAACQALERAPVPVICAVRGEAIGAGCQLALAGDLRIACSDLRMGMPVLKLGVQLTPPFAARLVEQGGPQLASDLLFTGRLVGAAEALERGLVAQVAAPADFERQVAATVAAVARLPVDALCAAKRALRAQRSSVRGALPERVAGHAANLDDLHGGVEQFLFARRHHGGAA